MPKSATFAAGFLWFEHTGMKDKKNCEAEILKAAEAEFLEKGYTGARTVSIAEKAGITHAMLHYYYRSKEQLFQRILQEKAQLFAAHIYPVLMDKQIALPDKIPQVMGQHFDFLTENPMLPRFLMNEAARHPESFAEIRQKVESLLKTCPQQLQLQIDEAVRYGRIAPIQAVTLLTDMFLLNLSTFLCFPALTLFYGEQTEEIQKMLQTRKKENTELILSRLRPKKDNTPGTIPENARRTTESIGCTHGNKLKGKI